MANTLGLIVSGRLVQTDWTIVSDSQLLITIPEADNINHVVVFLTGMTPLPPGSAGMVYWSWGDPTAPPQWQLLGHISNNKPSAIFKISGLKKLHELPSPADNAFSGAFGVQPVCHHAQVGVAIEPEINAQMLSHNKEQENANNYVTFAQKMLESLFNYIASFSVTPAQIPPSPAISYVPLTSLQTWYQNFERRLQQNPHFWRNL